MEEIKKEHLNHVELRNSISGSLLFDWHKNAMASHICSIFPGLNKREEKDENGVRWLIVEGDLNDFWYNKYVDFVFNSAMDMQDAD